MATNGNAEYYRALSSLNPEAHCENITADLSTHEQSESLGDMIRAVSELAAVTSDDYAQLAADSVTQGLTREVLVDDFADWQLLREQIRSISLDLKLNRDLESREVLPIAVSYKAKEETFIQRVTLLRHNETMDEEMREEVEIMQRPIRSSEFLNDRRWYQLQRASQEYARSKGYRKVCFWIDRIMKIGVSKKMVSERQNKLNLDEYGLYPYMLMATVRMYDPSETEFGTSFWRKVEAVLTISGKGLICDDYMMRKYDKTIYYDHTLYRRLRNGIIMIGGKTMFIRSTILALETMIIVDGVAITKANEHPKTIESMVQWKSWAMKCIVQEAFARRPAVPISNVPLLVDEEAFKFSSSWEYMLCN